MREDGDGPGERAARRRRRQIRTLVGIGLAVGFVVGFAMAFLEREGAASPAIPPWFAILAVAVGGLAMLGGGVGYWRRTDELDRRDNMWASMIGLNVYALLYPGWWMLWKGGWVPVPDGEIVFVATLGAFILSYGWLKYRN